MAYAVEMEADEAHLRLKRGGTLLLLDAPEHLVFGIDQTAFLVGPKFQGVKMIPPGPHIITTTLLTPNSSVPTVARWVCVTPGCVEVARWDADFGRFSALSDPEEVSRYCFGVQRFDFDAGLAPYPLHSHLQWQALSCHIKMTTVAAMGPLSGFIDPLAEAHDLNLMKPCTKAERTLLQQLSAARDAFPDADAASSSSPHASPVASRVSKSISGNPADTARHTDRQPRLASDRAFSSLQRERKHERCRYTAIPARVQCCSSAAVGALTAANMDKSFLLEELFLSKEAGSSRLLAELQFAFINFIAGKSLEGLLHWKALLALLFSCDKAATETHCDVFAAVLHALSAQLTFAIPKEKSGRAHGDDTDADIAPGPEVAELMHDSVLRRGAIDFLEVLTAEADKLPQALYHQVQLFQRVLEDRVLGGAFVAEADGVDHEGPVVVELQEAPQA